MTKPTPRGILTRIAPPPDLARWIDGFVHRDDTVDGKTVVVLPETRASIQIFSADIYWLREQDEQRWHPVPREGLWGPRYNWAYGFAEHHIKVFGVGLTPEGAAALTGRGMPDLIDRVVSLPDAAPATSSFAVEPNETFEAWTARQTSALRYHLTNTSPDPIPWNAAAHILATAAGGAIREAAAATGLSERQFRRLFRDRYGVAPKQYQRVLRVDRLLRQLHPAPWESDAIEDPVSFADQPHIIREFRALIGLTPTAYVRVKSAENDRVLRSVAAPNVAGPSPAQLKQSKAKFPARPKPAIT